jgi:predicted membrane protein
MKVFISVYAPSLILLLILLYCYMFRSYDHHQAENILLARITQLITDLLFYSITNIIGPKIKLVTLYVEVTGHLLQKPDPSSDSS